MGFKWNKGSGGLFRNKYKEKESHPDHKGKCTVECYKCGEELQLDIAAWIKEGANGKFFSLSVQEAYKKDEGMSQPATNPPADYDEDVPF